jgi:hypothetical protein
VVEDSFDVPVEDDSTATQTLAPADTDEQIDGMFRAWRERTDANYLALRRQARSSFTAIEGWQRVQSADEWVALCDTAVEEYQSGRFLIERLGAERMLDPALMATLWRLRQELLRGLDATTAHEYMLVDMALLSYHHLLRFNGWIGNFALLIEHEFFAQESPTAKHHRRYGRPYDFGRDGFQVEDYVQRVGEQLLPLMDRAQRMFIRALRELRRSPSAGVAIGQAGQVNVGAVQHNVASPPDADDNRPTVRRRRRSRSAPAVAETVGQEDTAEGGSHEA